MQGFWVLTFILLLQHAVAFDDLLSKFTQNDYRVKDIRLEVDSVNRKFVRFINVKTFKFNRTTPSINASVNYFVNTGMNLECLVQAYKLGSSNEYKIFPIRMQLNLYKAFHANLGGMLDGALKCSYLNDTYFIKDTTYYVCNFVVDETKFPPLIPSGRYKATLTFLYFQHKLGVLSGFGEVYRPIYPKY